VTVVDPGADAGFSVRVRYYCRATGAGEAEARKVLREDATALAAVVLLTGGADALICGTSGTFHEHLRRVEALIGKASGVHDLSAVTALVLPSGTLFTCDTHVHPDPAPEHIADVTLLAADCVRRFGFKPRVAPLSHSSFGSHDDAAARKMRAAVGLLNERDPALGAEGEMRADSALNEEIRRQASPGTRIRGPANLLVF